MEDGVKLNLEEVVKKIILHEKITAELSRVRKIHKSGVRSAKICKSVQSRGG